MKKFLCAFLLLLLVADSAYATTLTLPANLTEIGDEAFMNVDADNIELPENVKQIRSRAFAGSSSTMIMLPASLEYIAEDAFEGSALEYVIAEKGTYAYQWAVRKGYIDDVLESPASDFEYGIFGGECWITRYIGSKTEVCIPSVIENTPVTSIRVCF